VPDEWGIVTVTSLEKKVTGYPTSLGKVLSVFILSRELHIKFV